MFETFHQSAYSSFSIVVFCVTGLAGPCLAEQQGLSADEATQLGIDAYVYGYPLVTMEMTRRVMTNVATADGLRGPMGQFVSARQFPSSAFRDITAPNTDTLYSVAWVDLATEPFILSLPDASDRYFLMPILSGWTEVFAVPGSRTTGTKPQKYALTGPHWQGSLPDGVTEYKSPTSLVWVFGRTYCTGTPQDYEIVHRLQNQYSIVPLSAYGKPYRPSQGEVDPMIDMQTPVREQVNRMDAATYFQMLASLMKDNPTTPADKPMVERMAKIGVKAGHHFDINTFGSDIARALRAVPIKARLKIVGHITNSGRFVNGWIYVEKAGVYGTDYLQRALIAAVGLGANRPQDAVYPTSQLDGDGNVYDGAHRYVLHFPKGQTPPANGFWSLTMYNGEMFFVDNPLNRFAVRSHFDFKYNEDGSLDLFIQKDSPGTEMESNWLPSADGKFILMLRLYWPQDTSPSIIDGTWQPPAVHRRK